MTKCKCGKEQIDHTVEEDVMCNLNIEEKELEN